MKLTQDMTVSKTDISNVINSQEVLYYLYKYYIIKLLENSFYIKHDIFAVHTV